MANEAALLQGRLIGAATRTTPGRRVNVPINEALARWDPVRPPADWAMLRDTWNRSNLLRSLAAGACFLAAVGVPAHSPQRLPATTSAGRG